MPQMLAVRYSNKGGATQIQVFRNNAGSYTAFGNPFTPSRISTDNVGLRKHNLAVQFGDEFYCSAGRDIRRYNPATGNWDVEVTDYYAGTSDWDGPLLVGRGPTGTPRLICVFRGTAFGTLTVRYLDTPGGAWPAEVDLGLSGTTGDWPTLPPFKFNNEVYFAGRGYHYTVNIATLSGTVQLFISTNIVSTSFAKVGNRAFVCVPSSTSTTSWTDLYEQIGGTWVKVVDGTINEISGRGTVIGNRCMIYDEASDSLIVFCYQDTATAAGMNPGGNGFQITRYAFPGLTESDITGAAAPAGLASPGGNDPNGDIGMCIEVDSDTDPLNPLTYLWLCQDDGNWARFSWNGIGSAMLPAGGGGDRGIALSDNKFGGGEYYYDGSTTANPNYHIEEVQARVPIIGGTRIFLRGNQTDETGGSPTPTDETVALYWGTTQSVPDNLASISNIQKVSGPGTVATISANKIQNFTFDGTTIYSVDWAAISDGVANQQQHTLMPHAET